MKDRRETLKIVGAIGSTCAFPFAANELYGQHAAHEGQAAALPRPSFFTAAELAAVTRLADLIIPATSTPGAVAAGVPAYIDMVVGKNAAAQKLYRAGLAALDAACGKPFVQLDEAAQIAVLTPLCEAADAKPEGGTATVALFRAVKSMTADGYYTSKAGLIDELGYQGNAVLAEFPVCVHEH